MGLGSTETCVLVVDDDVNMRTLLREVLGQEGYGVIEAASGTEAIATLRTSSPDLIISDVQMANGSGYEVCRALRQQLGRDVPFMFLSGTRTEAYDRVAGFEFGADDYIVKPFDPEELRARVRALLRRAGAPSALSPLVDYGLTPREREVMGLLAVGHAQREIAAELHLSSATVGKHVERILKKLGVHSRAEAVARAHHERLVTHR